LSKALAILTLFTFFGLLLVNNFHIECCLMFCVIINQKQYPADG